MKAEAFPTTETAEHGPKLTTKWVSYQNFLEKLDRNGLHRPSLARLAPATEQKKDDPTADIDSPTTRTRHESVTSITSRAIPGGWVSNDPKSPGENGPSLENAAGEFSNNKPPAPAPTTKGKHQKKKSSSKCIIM